MHCSNDWKISQGYLVRTIKSSRDSVTFFSKSSLPKLTLSYLASVTWTLLEELTLSFASFRMAYKKSGSKLGHHTNGKTRFPFPRSPTSAISSGTLLTPRTILVLHSASSILPHLKVTTYILATGTAEVPCLLGRQTLFPLPPQTRAARSKTQTDYVPSTRSLIPSKNVSVSERSPYKNERNS